MQNDEATGNVISQLQMRQICFMLLLFMLPVLGACAAPVYPRYQPMAGGSLEATPQQGYSDYQIDERTYLITYRGFNPDATRSWSGLLHEKWLEMVQDFVLCRAAELAKSRGARRFVILHRDDSNQAWRVFITNQRYGSWQVVRGFIPSARVLIRLIVDDESSFLGSKDQVYEVDALIKRLMGMNAALARQQGLDASSDDDMANNHRLIRWRVPVLLDGPALEPLFAGLRSPLLEAEITEGAHGVFEFVQWSRLPLSPIDLLRQGVKIADREGYAVFKLENWATEEYQFGRHWNYWYDWSSWFRMKARLVLQHQKDADSLDPVFVVDEIRENVMR